MRCQLTAFGARKILFALLALFLCLQPCQAQRLHADSAWQKPELYLKGKRNIRAGGILLGIGAVGCLVGLGMSKPKPNGFTIGPSNHDMVVFLGGVVGFIGAIKLIQGAIRTSSAGPEAKAASF